MKASPIQTSSRLTGGCRVRFVAGWPGIRRCIVAAWIVPLFLLPGCQSPNAYRLQADQAAKHIIEEKQKQALGKTEAFSVEAPGDLLRRRLLLEQKLPYSGEASLGADRLKKIEHWPENDYPRYLSSAESPLPLEPDKPLQLSLLQALQVGARNSLEYQTRKEEVFRAALDLDLERDPFRSTFKGRVENLVSVDAGGTSTVGGLEEKGAFSQGRKFKSGIDVSAALAVDLVKLLTQGTASTLGMVADTTISIPLLRGSGKHIVTEPLTQAERNVIYAIYEFSRFRKTFAVKVARDYLRVLQSLNEVENSAENYRNLIISSRRSRRLADAGRATEIEVDQTVQDELRARNRWISADEAYKNRLDAFKGLLGLPPDAGVVLSSQELSWLVGAAANVIDSIPGQEALAAEEKPLPADAPVELVKPGRDHAGPFEMDPSAAVKLGMEHRLDLRVLLGKVYDAQRKVVVAADALSTELTLLGRANLGASRSLAAAARDDARLRTDKGIYTALLTLDLPLERTAERNAYRDSYILLERALRDVQKLEDEMKQSIREKLRNMAETRETLKIQARAVFVAEKRVKSTTLFFEAGRTKIRDLLEAQEALLTAKNRLTSALVGYRVAELEFQQDTGLLAVDEKGLWQEYQPEGKNHGKEKTDP
ncbi:MAG: TolC family protein [Desulfobacterales bacterium]|nr:TolC family protein [Desulfobacterales bacterium]